MKSADFTTSTPPDRLLGIFSSVLIAFCLLHVAVVHDVGLFLGTIGRQKLGNDRAGKIARGDRIGNGIER